MIAKELDPFYSTDKFQVAGRKAEEQMAFYLRRYFATEEDIYVINGLKIFANGESAQFDHLIVHPNGLIIIESKSVASKITVTADNQWIREYGDKSSGMKSPIIQAEMQKMIFGEFAKSLNQMPKTFLGDNIQLLISISDHGIINWSDRLPISNVLKADQICKAAIAIIENSALGKTEEYVPADAVKQWFEHNTEIGVFKRIPNRNWVPWIAHFLSACNGLKDDPITLLCPDKSLEDGWRIADDQTKRQIIYGLLPGWYSELWCAVIDKSWQKTFYVERIRNQRAMAYKTHGFKK